MEVGDERLCDHDRAGGGYHQGCGGMQSIEMMHLQIFHDSFKAFLCRRQSRSVLIREPLVYMQVALFETLFEQHHSDPIHRFDGAHAGGAHRDDGSVDVIMQMLDGLAFHNY